MPSIIIYFLWSAMLLMTIFSPRSESSSVQRGIVQTLVVPMICLLNGLFFKNLKNGSKLSYSHTEYAMMDGLLLD